MAYHGPERRIHRVFVTRNTEYHVRKDRCVAVRDRRSGRWLHGHFACGSQVSGGIRFSERGGMLPNVGTPAIGESVFFHARGRDVVTSPVVSVERPPREVVSSYPA
ncbi:MAG: hypothetical protein ACODAU_03255 [Myxococcota bacterium]